MKRALKLPLKLPMVMAIGLAVSGLLNGCTSGASEPVNLTTTTSSYQSNDSAMATCDASWFPHQQTPPPAEGKGSPFDRAQTNNIDFHRWSWQKFLWLTKPGANGKPLFENELNLVDNRMIPVKPINGVKLVLTDITQADGGILMSNPQYNPAKNHSYTVYYSIHTNSILQREAEEYSKAIVRNPAMRNNLDVFSPGSLELKVAWIDINAIESNKRGNYYTTDAIMPDAAAGSRFVTVALVGMHVTGVVINHPEFIWATFEHQDLAPSYRWSSPDEGSSYLHHVRSSDQKLFYQKGYYAGRHDIDLPKPPKPAKAQNVFTLYRYGVPKHTFGGPGSRGQFTKSSQDETNKPNNFDNIGDINRCVAQNLNGVWNNYFYNGSIWADTDGKTPEQIATTIQQLGRSISNVAPGAIARGSVAASNITMETYFQYDNNADDIKNVKIGHVENCFSCHSSKITLISNNSDTNKSPLYLSHIFSNLLRHKLGASVEQIEALGALSFKQSREQ